MAITRCPYCHAITDETDKYCNNCGTQLLFPEDEEIEEDIPGEKIIDAETEEKDYGIDEPEEGKISGDEEPEEELSDEALEGTEEIDLEDLIEEETEKASGLDEPEVSKKGEEPEEDGEDEDEVGGDVIVLDEAELTADAGESFLKAAPDAEETGPDAEPPREGTEPPPDEETRELAAVEAEEQAPGETPPMTPHEPGSITEPGPESEAPPAAGPIPPTFDTIELESMGKTVELGKDKIDQFLEALAETKSANRTPQADTREPTGTLPPWASAMKGAPAFSDVKDTGEPTLSKDEEKGPWEVGEQEIFPRKKPSDSTIGFPEKVTQAVLPFGAVTDETAEMELEKEHEEKPFTGEAAEEQAVEEEAEEEAPRGFLRADRREAAAPSEDAERGAAEAAEEREPPSERLPFDITAILKSKVFDALFVGVFWLAALWLAARAVGTTLFGILGAMSGSMLLLYAVLGLLYVFFFKFFLGETLGDRLFRRRE